MVVHNNFGFYANDPLVIVENCRGILLQLKNSYILSARSFTLYPAHSRVGWAAWLRSLALRHSVPSIPPNCGDITSRVAVLNAAHCIDTKAKKCKYEIYHIFKWESNPQSVIFPVPLHHSYILILTNLKKNPQHVKEIKHIKLSKVIITDKTQTAALTLKVTNLILNR